MVRRDGGKERRRESEAERDEVRARQVMNDEPFQSRQYLLHILTKSPASTMKRRSRTKGKEQKQSTTKVQSKETTKSSATRKSAAATALHGYKKQNSRDLFWIKVVVGVLSVLLYSNTWSHGFVFDDHRALIQNGLVTGDYPWRELFSRCFWGIRLDSGTSTNSWRPLCTAIFRIVASFSRRPLAFHFLNTIVNTAVSVIAVSTISMVTDATMSLWIAALLFAVHPVRTEAVNSIVGLSDVGSSLLMLLTVNQTLKARQSRARQPAVWACLLALLASGMKETGIGALLISIGLEILDLLHSQYGGNSQQTKPTVIRLVIYAVGFALFLALRLVTLTDALQAPNILTIDNPLYHLQSPLTFGLTVGFVQWKVMQLLLAPMTLSFDYSFGAVKLVDSWTDARVVLVAIVILVAMTVSVVALHRHITQGQCAMTLSMALIVVPSLPMFHLFPVGLFIAERLLYLPALGVAVLVGLAYDRLIHSKKDLVLTVIVIAFALRTVTRNFVWSSTLSLFQAHEALFPEASKLLMGQAMMYYQQKNYPLAIEYAQRSYNLGLKLDSYRWPYRPDDETGAYRLIKGSTDLLVTLYETPGDHASSELAELWKQRVPGLSEWIGDHS